MLTRSGLERLIRTILQYKALVLDTLASWLSKLSNTIDRFLTRTLVLAFSVTPYPSAK
jgi:hypothetical protein